MDRGAWRAPVHWVAKSQIGLSMQTHNVDQLKYSLMRLSQMQGRTVCRVRKLRCRNGRFLFFFFHCPLLLFHL